MGQSVSCRFFLARSEVDDVVERVVDQHGTAVYWQVRHPGLVLKPVADIRAVPDSEEEPPFPSRLLLTRRVLPPGPQPGTFDGFGIEGLILLTLPVVAGDRFYLGTAGAKRAQDDDMDWKAAQALVRGLKKAAPKQVLFRGVGSTDEARPAGVGISDAAARLADESGLRLCQFAVDNVEYVPG